jgi:hypothetical protein
MVDIIGVKNENRINAFTDYKKHGLDYVCERVYKYNDFVKLMKSNERLELYIFKKLLSIGVIKKIGRISIINTDKYDTAIPKKVRENINGVDSEDEYDYETFGNKEELDNYLTRLTSYDGDEYIYELIDKYNNFKSWNKKIKNTHNELIIKIFHKEKGINCVVKNTAYKKTDLYKELRKRKREKSPPSMRKMPFKVINNNNNLLTAH